MASAMSVHPDLVPFVRPVDPDGFKDPVRRRKEVHAFLDSVLPDSPAWLATLTSDDCMVPGLDGEPGVPVRIIRPARADVVARPCVVWFHGSGFITGKLELDSVISSRYAAELDAVVVHVDYRLAPENPFPAAVRDGYAVLTWLQRSAGDLGVDLGRLIIAGSSAGGALAAAMCLLVRDNGGPRPALQVLLYPVLDDRLATDSARNSVGVPVLTSPMVRDMWRHYLGDRAGGADVSPYAAPARAADLAGLPPAYILTAQLDPLHDEGIGYGRRLEKAGAPTTIADYAGAFHGFLNLDAAVAHDANRRLFDFIRAWLDQPSPDPARRGGRAQ